MRLTAKSLRFQAFFSISIIMTITIFIVVMTIPKMITGNAEKNTVNTAIIWLEQFKALRSYYTDNVVRDVLENSDLTTSYDHIDSPYKIPLPATMIHELSLLTEKKGTTYSLYSAFPFPNRKNRQLDAFQLRAWRDLQQNPEKIIKKIISTDQQVILRVAMSDQMQVQACVDCHNTHLLSPKVDWKLGDVRGVLEMKLDITSQLALANNLSTYIIMYIVLGATVLIFISFLFISRITKLFNDISKKIIQVGEGDYEVELSHKSNTVEFYVMEEAFSLFKSTLMEREHFEKQKQLFETEKSVLLGQMMATILHDVNTPLGVSITAASCIQDAKNDIETQLLSGELKRRDLEAFVSLCDKSSSILLHNLIHATDLLKSFKQITIDQVSEEPREIGLTQYITHIIDSLKPKLKKAGVNLDLECPLDCYFYTCPGFLAQIITNLITNSIIHGFGERKGGKINLSVFCQNENENENEIVIHYNDDGVGMAPENLPKAMDIFFTTKRDAGGSGLGLNIVQNIVTQKLHGTIEIQSVLGEGVSFDIRFPRVNNLNEKIMGTPSNNKSGGSL